MPISVEVSSQQAEKVRADLLAVPVFADAVPGPGADAVDEAMGGGLRAFMEEAGFAGKPGETLAVPTGGRLAAKAAILVGMGDPDDVTLERLRRAAGALARRATKVRSVVTTLAAAAPKGLDAADVARALAEGAVLGSYQFLEYKTDRKPWDPLESTCRHASLSIL